MLPINKVKEIISRYETLEKTLSQTDIDKNTYVKNSKEYSSIGDIIVDVKNYIKMVEDKEGSEKILEDKSADKELKEIKDDVISFLKDRESIAAITSARDIGNASQIHQLNQQTRAMPNDSQALNKDDDAAGFLRQQEDLTDEKLSKK